MRRATTKRADVEGPIHRACIDYLRLTLPDAVVHHSPAEVPLQGNDVARAIAKAKWNGMLVGFPDILCIWRGHVWCFEVKAPGGYPTTSQATLGEQIERNGAHWSVVRSVDDVASCIASWAGEQKSVAVEIRGVVR